MSRYIDAGALCAELEHKKELMERGNSFNTILIAHTIGIVQEEVKKFPTADVAPVVHAHWIDKEVQIGIPKYHYIVCSECSSGYNIVYVHLLDDGKLFNRCPKCGAKMDEETEEK